jgi:hypothetical protein
MLSLLGLVACTDAADRDPRNRQRNCRALARASRLVGKVSVRMQDTGWTADSFELQKLCVGDRISTDSSGFTAVRFSGGASLQLNPNSTLILRERGADLIAGKLIAKTVEGGSAIDIKTPLGVAALGTRLSEMVISVDQGIQVKVGQVTLVGDHAETKTVQSGQTLTVQGLRMAAPAASRSGSGSGNGSGSGGGGGSGSGSGGSSGEPDESGKNSPSPAGAAEGSPAAAEGAPASSAPRPAPVAKSSAAPAVVPAEAPADDAAEESADGAEASVDSVAPPRKPLPSLPDFKPSPGEPTRTYVLQSPSGAQIMLRGQKTWTRLGRRATVHTGDRLWAQAGPARLHCPGGGELRLEAMAQVDLTPLNQFSKDGTWVDVALRAGSSELLVPRPNKGAALYTLRVGTRIMQVRPTVLRAQVRVEHAEKNPGVGVHFGSLHLDPNSQVEAGNRFTLVEGQEVPRLEPLAPEPIEVSKQSNTVITYPHDVPSIQFNWAPAASPATAPPTLWELAKTAAFRPLVAAETLRAGHLIVTQLDPGHYLWRLDGNKAALGQLRLIREEAADSAGSIHSSVIADTGEQTVVYFQEKLPEIVLTWRAVPRAAGYGFKMYADGDFDKPVFDKAFSGLSHKFGKGQFVHEGRYFWQVTALDSSGAPLVVGQMSSLVIGFDNAISALKLREPKQNAHLAANACVVAGEAELGSEVYIGSERLNLDKQGRFHKTLNLWTGPHRLVLRSLSKTKVERVYLRDIMVK